MNDNNIKTFYVLDLDRTLFDTEKAMSVMQAVLELHDQGLALAMSRTFQEYSERGESFSVRDFIVERSSEANMELVEARYHEAARAQDLLMPGAKELISLIRSRSDADFGILTYGSPKGQAMKMRATAGLEEVPFLVTEGRHKGEQIAAWRQEDGMYLLPEPLGGIVAREVVFVDDKPFSFAGFPVDGTGYQVQGAKHSNDEQLPAHVTVVTGLDDVVRLETDRYA